MKHEDLTCYVPSGKPACKRIPNWHEKQELTMKAYIEQDNVFATEKHAEYLLKHELVSGIHYGKTPEGFAFCEIEPAMIWKQRN